VRKTFLSTLALAALLVGPAFAQDKPIVVVSVSSVEKLVADITQLAQIADAGPRAQAAPAGITLVAGTLGIDVKKPAGVAVFLKDGAPQVLGFIPCTNFQQFTNGAAAFNIPLKDNGDGTWALQGPGGGAVLKESNGYIYVSQLAAHLANLPADPVALLGGLEKQYGIGARLNVAAIPAEVKGMAIGAMKNGMQQGMRRLPNEDDAQFGIRRRMVEGQLRQLEGVINDAETLTFGWAVDPSVKSTFLEVAMTAVAGSNLAKQAAANADVKSEHAGFLVPGAAVKANLASKLDPNDQQAVGQLIEEIRGRFNKEIDNNNDIPNDAGKSAVKDIVAKVFDVMKSTAQAGKIDAGATLLLGEKSLTFAAGGFVADGKALEEALRKLVDLAKNEPDFPGMNFKVETYQGVDFHATSVPVPDPQAQQVFGNKLDVVIGTGPKSAYLAIGKDTIPTLKSIIDKSAAGGATLPLQASLSLTPVLKFISSVQPNPIAEMVSQEVAKASGKDQIVITSKIVPNGSVGRLELEEGVLKAIGAGVKAGMQQFGGGGPGGPQPF